MRSRLGDNTSAMVVAGLFCCFSVGTLNAQQVSDECKTAAVFQVCGEYADHIESASDAKLVIASMPRDGVTKTETVRVIRQADIFEKLPLKLPPDALHVSDYARFLIEDRARELNLGKLSEGSSQRCVLQTPGVYCMAEIAYVGEKSTIYLGGSIIHEEDRFIYYETLIEIVPPRPAKDIHTVYWAATDLRKSIIVDE